MFKRSILAAMLLAVATPALAHTGHDVVSGFLFGFSHPLGGLDHVLAMVSVGLFAALLGGRALWAPPASFVGMMLVGGILGLSGIEVPAVEFGIAMSIVVLGAIVTWVRQWPILAAVTLVGVFALFHGYAHGAEIPVGSDAALYSLGFALASAMLHGVGISAGLLTSGSTTVMRLTGAVVTMSGIIIAFG
ncbi:HupE/UreJ family protein [Microvirga sp. VF16]|nr:HupE/UreJ family protein [Microvirga sp. VF16]QRM31893.1 HupE/UreJ family protein [Microvirga sp. VF16]